MLRELLAQNEKHHIKFLDLKQCKINSKNLELISKLIAHNNGLLSKNESKSLKRLLNSHKLSRSLRNNSAELNRGGNRSTANGSRGSICKARASIDNGIRIDSKNSPMQLPSQKSLGSLNSNHKVHFSNDKKNRHQMLRQLGNENYDSIQEIVIQQDYDEGQPKVNCKTCHSQTKKKKKKYNLVDSRKELKRQIKMSQSCHR